MKIARDETGVVYLLTLRPEKFAFDLYATLLSFLFSTFLWVLTLRMCASVKTSTALDFVCEFLLIHLIFASVTLCVWIMLFREEGQGIAAHLMLYLWHGAKLAAVFTECLYLDGITQKLMVEPTVRQRKDLMVVLFWGLVVVVLLECFGFLVAVMYWRLRKTMGSPARRLSPSDAVYSSTTALV